MKIPVTMLAVCWVFGSYLAYTCGAFWLLLIEAAMLGLLCLCVKLHLVKAVQGMVCFAMLALSSCYTLTYDRLNQSDLPAGPTGADDFSAASVELKGTLSSVVEVDGDRASFTVKSQKLQVSGRSGVTAAKGEKFQVRLRLMSEVEQEQALQWKRGDLIRLVGELSRPDPARNFGGFDYRNYLHSKHIHWTIKVKGTEQMEVTPPSRWGRYTILRWNDQIRALLGAKLDALFSTEQSGYMKSLLIGLRDDLDPQQFQQFSQLGMTHILAISGLHVAVMLGACMGLLRLMGATRETNLTVAMALVPIYVAVSGASPSVVRAGLMAVIVLYAARKRILKDGLRIICLVGLLMLLWNPYYLLDVSFQLSFIVTIGLIVGVPRVMKLLPISSQRINSLLSVTFVAQFVSFPLSVYYFNQFSLLSWLANLLLVPLISFVILPLGYAAMLVGFIYEAGGRWMCVMIEFVNSVYFRVIQELNEYTQFVMIWPSPSHLWIVLYYTLLYLIVWSLSEWRNSRPGKGNDNRVSVGHGRVLDMIDDKYRRDAWIPWIFISLTAVLLWYGYDYYRGVPYGEVDFVDVSQGDAILIRTPSNRIILIDGGGTLSFRKPGEDWKERKDPYEVGRKLLVPLLKKRGVHHIDYLIISHGDTDHTRGLQEVVKQIPVKRILFNGTLKSSSNAVTLFRSAVEKGIPLYQVGKGKEVRIDRYTSLHILAPLFTTEGKVAIENDQNDLSLVFLFKMHQTSFLFTGDMESNIEQRIIEHALPASTTGIKPVDVLKVAHHGSKTSTTEAWLDYWKPRMAVISVGKYNTYGHPYDQVIDRLVEHKAAILRTDLNGEVQLRVYPNSLTARVKITDKYPQAK